MEITIKVHESKTIGSNHFLIYEVITVWKNGDKHTSGRYLNEKKAEETAKMWRDMEDVKTAFVIEELIFI